MSTLQRAWRTLVDTDPEALAYTALAARTPPQAYSRAALHRTASGRAAVLRERGVAPGAICAVALASDSECAEWLLGILLLGAVPILAAPLDLRADRAAAAAALCGVVERTRARALVVAADAHDALARVVERGCALCAPTDTVAVGGGDVSVEASSAGAIAALQLTSGTTGRPRACAWSHEQVLAAIDGMVGAMDLSPQRDRMMTWVPLYHDMGLVNNFLLCLLRGLPLWMLPPTAFIRRPALWLRSLSDHGITHTWAPNFGYAVATARVADAELEGVRLEHVVGLWNAAERIHAATVAAFARRFAGYGLRRAALGANFGCAEHIGGATFSAPGAGIAVEHVDGERLRTARRAEVVDPAAAGAVPVVGVGAPVPGCEVAVLGPDGAALPDGAVGVVALRSPSCMLGYLDEAGAVDPAVAPLRTGDLGYLRGGELFWVGRDRETLVLRGRKIDPSEFEAPLLSVAGARPGCFAVFGIEDPERGTERLVVLCERRDDHSVQSVEQGIRAAVEAAFGLAVDDVRVYPAGTLTKTSSGKRRHLGFRDLYLRGALPEPQS